ncbi:helix-turn-helix domain-containing protein [Bacillus velezensis]|uniref:helix-turn-helix domain-containing protein n=1 Tax=Bacillus amyloliquefaciens group TaxID=1938374 RepID=UPI000E27D879|nr:helix-turn-helix transcriptional regulator [Bacillus amyloliquefaciens]RDY83116.1 XRE family transcriptional regulator [Bacillus amyloliquefaciens]
MNYFRKELGEKIYRYRKSINMSTTELAHLSRTAQSTISKIENGNSSPTIETLIKICEALGVTLYDVLPESVFPDPKQHNPYNTQLLNVLNQMSECEIELVQSFMTTNILPVLKNITPLTKALHELNAEERELLRNFINSITNITVQDKPNKREG